MKWVHADPDVFSGVVDWSCPAMICPFLSFLIRISGNIANLMERRYEELAPQMARGRRPEARWRRPEAGTHPAEVAAAHRQMARCRSTSRRTTRPARWQAKRTSVSSTYLPRPLSRSRTWREVCPGVESISPPVTWLSSRCRLLPSDGTGHVPVLFRLRRRELGDDRGHRGLGAVELVGA